MCSPALRASPQQQGGPRCAFSLFLSSQDPAAVPDALSFAAWCAQTACTSDCGAESAEEILIE